MQDPKNSDFFARKVFFASVTHELRTPIQTILGTLELLGETSLDTEQMEYFHQLQFSADVLLSLINDFLDISKIEHGNFAIENELYNPSETVEKIVDLLAIEAHKKGLELIADIDFNLPQTLLGDQKRIQQVLLNLLKNAVKFTQVGSIKVSLTLNKEKNALIFEVKDTGNGIAEETKNKLFSAIFVTETALSNVYGGSGLGLIIAKNLVELMGGQIDFSSVHGKGSCFWFSLPVVQENYANTNSLPCFYKEHMLIIDDCADTVSVLEKKLLHFFFADVETASEGQEGLEKMQQAAKEDNPFSVVFIDMCLQKMDGWQLAALINEDKTINSAKLYLMIPEGQMGLDAKMKLLQWFNGYLYKPIKNAALLHVLRDLHRDSLDLEVVHTENQQEIKYVKNSTLTVLVAEDHPINLQILIKFLNSFGTNVFAAENGVEAVNQIKKNPQIDLIFMDIQMPILDGIDATKQIRSNGFMGTIIASTANTEASDFEMYYKIGINDILVKPYKKDNVFSMLEKWKK